MNFKATESAIRAFFNTGWAAATPISWPDTPFTPPDSATWVRFTMKNNDTFQASTGAPGANRFRTVGFIYIDIFQPAGQGSTDARTKADTAAALFRGNTLSGVLFRNVNARDMGVDPSGLYRWQVRAEFQHDHIT